MYFDNNNPVQKHTRPFVYIQYPKTKSAPNDQNTQLYDGNRIPINSDKTNGISDNTNENKEQILPHKLNQQTNVSSPSSTSSSASSPIQINKFQLEKTTDDKQPKKKKRQHVGYACDKCRERRVGCDRGKPICGQCKDRYHCQYSNHALRLDNTSMRQRLDDLENQVGWLTSFVTSLEQEYRTVIPHNNIQVQPFAVAQPPVLCDLDYQDASQSSSLSQVALHSGSSVYDWAIETGWPVIENADGVKSIFTNIKRFEDLSEVLKNTVEAIYNVKGYPLYRHPENITQHSSNNLALNGFVNTFQKNQLKTSSGSEKPKAINNTSKKEHTFTLFESLNRYTKSSNPPTSTDEFSLKNEHYLETDVMTRLIHQHHKCGFPTLVSPLRFEKHYRQGQLKSLVLSSVFSHSVPHCCIYHPHLIQIEDFRELGDKFYNHSHDLLGVDEAANLSNIHQRTLLITYDLDLGRVRRAFLHIGIAIRMCYMLNLHRPEGYVSCKSAFEREQSKRVFWTVWFYDNMVSHLFHDQLSTIRLDDISIELPTPLPEFNQIEMDQTIFTINIIQIRKLAASISEKSRELEPRALVNKFRERLRRYYHTLSRQLQFGKDGDQGGFPHSLWARRNYFCTLLDYCQCWITMYRALLPSAHHQGDRLLTGDETEAILHTSQAAAAIVQLFQNWFKASLQSGEGFDCFFRPYLYHFMSAKHIFSSNVSQFGRLPALVCISRAYLVLILQLYQTTPTRRSFDESQLEKDMMQFMELHQIGSHEVVYQTMVDEALLDDPNADGGWSIFSHYTDSTLRENFGKDVYLMDDNTYE